MHIPFILTRPLYEDLVFALYYFRTINFSKIFSDFEIDIVPLSKFINYNK